MTTTTTLAADTIDDYSMWTAYVVAALCTLPLSPKEVKTFNTAERVPALAPETEDAMRSDCKRFVAENAEVLATSGLTAVEIGTALWQSRNRLSRDGFEARNAGEAGPFLAAKAHDFGKIQLFIGADSALHLRQMQ